jgi:hypothetical protein
MITEQDFNRFSTNLAEFISLRAKGEEKEIIEGVRPQDEILTGFLTPLRDLSLGYIQNNSSEEVPHDSHYEQTSIGIEWESKKEINSSSHFIVELKFSIFVRRIPTLELQKKLGRNLLDTRNNKVQEFIHVWSKHSIGPIHLEVTLADLFNTGYYKLSLKKEIIGILESIPKENSFNFGRTRFPIDILESEEAYRNFINTRNRPIDFLCINPFLDVRAHNNPHSAERVKIIARIINCSDVLQKRQLEIRDNNLYSAELNIEFPKDIHQSMIFRELSKSYRYDRHLEASGINTHVKVVENPNTFLFISETVPKLPILRLEPRTLFTDATPKFKNLVVEPISVLKNILFEMKKYGNTEWVTKLRELESRGMLFELEEAKGDYNRYLIDEVKAFEHAIEILESPQYDLILQAFKLMNKTMDLVASKEDKGKYESWRLFQIVFIVIRIVELAARQYPELKTEEETKIEVLWFAAGGGKTEAFLGIIVWQAFFDRLRGKMFGVTAFIRYPLRLLTFQQLQRLGVILGQAELVRRDEKIDGVTFSMGFFVGRTVTPNNINDVWHKYIKNNGPRSGWQIIYQCMYCLGPTELYYDEKNRLIQHRCQREGCLGRKPAMPVYIVDQDIYRFVPTVVVSTVDKMALFGQNQRFGNLLGRFDQYCTEHGASFCGNANTFEFSPCTAAKGYNLSPDKCGPFNVIHGPFVDPGPALLVQDELHLLNEELGAFDSHYETTIMKASQSLGFEPWKVIAATATIEKFENHGWHLYLRKSRQFPAPGPTAYDSFYYHQNENRIGRIYMGLIGVGRKHTPAVTKLLTLIYLELQKARDLLEENPQLVCDRYRLNNLSKNELEKIIFLYELPLIYVLTRKGSDQVSQAIEARVKRDLANIAPQHGELRIEVFNGGIDIDAMMQTMDQLKKDDPEHSTPEERTRGLVATNIIGHGVDVNRFNIMVFAGFTRLVAEYIQASARVGRTFPGISILVITPQSERDRSIFDRFEKFHYYIDRLVDPSAVNRWPLNALNKTIPGLLSGYLLTVASGILNSPLTTVKAIYKAYGATGIEPPCLNKEEVAKWLCEALNYREAPDSELYYKTVRKLVIQNLNKIQSAWESNPNDNTAINKFLDAMTSLRDIDEPGYIFAYGDSSNVLRRIIGHE